MKLKDFAKKEIDRMENVVEELKLIDKKGEKILELINSYFHDAKYFYDKRKYLQAFEAAVICWAYIDAGLHTKVFSVPKKFGKLFTI